MDIIQLRKDTPGCDNVIHFNNAGASLTSLPVYDAIQSYSEQELKVGGYETAEKFTKELEGFYTSVARLINSSPDEIAFTESATVAWQRVFYSIPFKKGDVIVTCVTEYASNYIAYLQLKQKIGIEIQVIPNDQNGDLDIQNAEQMLSRQPRLLSINHIPTNAGVVNPAEELGKLAQKYGVLYLLDSCQSVGQFPVDVQQIQCDFLCATGRKYLRGPRGTGFLFVSKRVLHTIEPVTLDLHSAQWVTENKFTLRKDARRFETWESNLANKLGLKTAIDNLNDMNIQLVWVRIQELGKKTRTSLDKIDGVTVQDKGSVLGGIVTFTTNQLTPVEIKNKLRQQNINVSVVDSSSALLDMGNRGLDKVVRASVHYYNTYEEIEILSHALSGMLNNS